MTFPRSKIWPFDPRLRMLTALARSSSRWWPKSASARRGRRLEGKADVVLDQRHDGGTGRESAHCAQALRHPLGTRPCRAHPGAGEERFGAPDLSLQTAASLRSPRDIAIAARWARSNGAIAHCRAVDGRFIMMRKCHLNLPCGLGHARSRPAEKIHRQAGIRRLISSS